MTRYEPLEHTADTGIEVSGRTLEEVFETAAYGLFDLMYGLEGLRSEGSPREVAVEAEGLEDLLVAWLEELLFLSETEQGAWCRFRVLGLEEGRLEALVEGVPFVLVELVGPPVKAITYHDLEVVQTREGWRARVIFDV